MGVVYEAEDTRASGCGSRSRSKHKVEGQGGYTVSIVNATVTVDGKTVVQDGKLTL